MDGVLIDARDWHYEALNIALSAFGLEIPSAEHLSLFDGLSTRQKLQYLTNNRGLPSELHKIISDTKQNRTLRIAAEKCFPNTQHLILIDLLRVKGFKIGVYTNSIRETAEAMLKYAGLLDKIDVLVTNQDVRNPKPDPEGYILACSKLKVEPQKTYVVEDGEYGSVSALAAGCRLIRVNGPEDVGIAALSKVLPELLK